MKKRINIVWLKRDLRTQDHAPFFLAEQAEEEYLPIYIFEPSMLEYPDSSLRHQQFIYHSLLELNQRLKKFGREITLFYGEAQEVFSYLDQKYNLQFVFSHRESGIRKTWERDKTIASFLSARDIQWKEFQRDGILRGITNRERWDKAWYAHVFHPVILNEYSKTKLSFPEHAFDLPTAFEEKLKAYPNDFQQAGEEFAWKYLNSFCEERGKNYSKHISKPLESRKSCARISPYLAWGNLSIRQACQFVRNHSNYEYNKRSFNAMITRLKWHCHFIQKFEAECSYETRFINSGFNTLNFTNNDQFIEAWKNGTTGFPLVDACMRCLKKTGWINFRMRAMVVSVFCHHFDCDWRLGVYHLAQLFLDYEPGIHYTQFQMQAGTTGINTVRIYNPVKQSKDHDPNGIFIRKWVKELEDIPVEFIHEPWKMTELEKEFYSIDFSYPPPAIDLEKSGRDARIKIWGHKKSKQVKIENERILKLHTRNYAVKKK